MFMFKRARNFAIKHGHCAIPTDYKEGDKQDLSKWAKRQRYQFTLYVESQKLSDEQKQRLPHGDRSAMTPARIQLLRSIGFCFDLAQRTWNLRYNELKDFVKEHGHANVPTAYSNRKLSSWVKVQRRWYWHYQLGKKHYPIKRIELLESLGFRWRLAPNSHEGKLANPSPWLGAGTDKAEHSSDHAEPPIFDKNDLTLLDNGALAGALSIKALKQQVEDEQKGRIVITREQVVPPKRKIPPVCLDHAKSARDIAADAANTNSSDDQSKTKKPPPARAGVATESKSSTTSSRGSPKLKSSDAASSDPPRNTREKDADTTEALDQFRPQSKRSAPASIAQTASVSTKKQKVSASTQKAPPPLQKQKKQFLSLHETPSLPLGSKDTLDGVFATGLLPSSCIACMANLRPVDGILAATDETTKGSVRCTFDEMTRYSSRQQQELKWNSQQQGSIMGVYFWRRQVAETRCAPRLQIGGATTKTTSASAPASVRPSSLQFPPLYQYFYPPPTGVPTSTVSSSLGDGAPTVSTGYVIPQHALMASPDKVQS